MRTVISIVLFIKIAFITFLGLTRGFPPGLSRTKLGMVKRGLAGLSASCNYYLMKCEPSTYSIDDMRDEINETACWEGVRNYQARNIMREMRLGDQAFFYHSNVATKEGPGIVGTIEVVKEAYPDPYAMDKSSKYYCEKSVSKGENRWTCVDVKLKERFAEQISLKDLKSFVETPEGAPLQNMTILQRGSRLSVTKMTEEEWRTIMEHFKPVAASVHALSMKKMKKPEEVQVKVEVASTGPVVVLEHCKS